MKSMIVVFGFMGLGILRGGGFVSVVGLGWVWVSLVTDGVDCGDFMVGASGF